MEKLNVAYCGLYCGACAKFKKGKCGGCQVNEKASWCEIRTCCRDNNYTTCADCSMMPLNACKKYNNFIAKVIGFVSRTERGKCIARIKEVGIEAFSVEMAKTDKMSIKK